MAFIVRKAFEAQIMRMRGVLVTAGSGMLLMAVAMVPDAAMARETDQSESAGCTDPKHRHVVLRPLTEPAPIRKKEKARIRRVLM